MDIQELIRLCKEWDVMSVLTDKKRCIFDIETLAIHTQAAVVSVAVVQLGRLWHEYDEVINRLADPYLGGLPPQTSYLYCEWGQHARDMVARKKAVASKDTLDWWGKLPSKAQEVMYSADGEWESDIIQVNTALADADNIWVHHPHFDVPIWESWCLTHVLPSGIYHRSVKDTDTLFKETPEIARVSPVVSHHALYDTLAMGLQVELCLLYNALTKKIATHYLNQKGSS